MVKKQQGKKTVSEKTESKKINNEEIDDTVKQEKADKEETEKKESIENKTEEESAEMQIQEMKDKYLRLSAEFDNYRKRTLKERIELTKTASEEIIKKMLPVVDDFERALQHMDDAKDINAIKDGVILIYNKLGDILKQQGVKEIDAMEKDFDMDIHEAITKIPAPEEKLKGKIVDVVEKGYYLHEKVLRYPKVVVGE